MKPKNGSLAPVYFTIHGAMSIWCNLRRQGLNAFPYYLDCFICTSFLFWPEWHAIPRARSQCHSVIFGLAASTNFPEINLKCWSVWTADSSKCFPLPTSMILVLLVFSFCQLFFIHELSPSMEPPWW